MTSWADLTSLQNILITYFFGSSIAYFIGMCILIFIMFVVGGLDFKLAAVFTTPIVLTYGIYGLFGEYTFVANIMLLIVGLVYAYVIKELFT